MRMLITLAVAFFAGFTLALTAPPHVSACTRCRVTSVEVVASDDTVVPARYAGRPGRRGADLADIGPVRRSGTTLESRKDPAGLPRVTLDDCGSGRDHGPPDTATAAAAGSPAQGIALSGPLIALAAMLGGVAMLLRLEPNGYPALQPWHPGGSGDRAMSPAAPGGRIVEP